MPPIWKKTIIVASIYIVIFMAVIIFALDPALSSLKQNKQKVADGQSKLDTTYVKLNALQKVDKHPDQFKATSDVVNNYWPDNLDVSYFLVQTENLAKGNNLIMENFSVEEVKKPVTVKESDTGKSDGAAKTAPKKVENGAQFTLSTTTSYLSILNFIKGMEILPRFNTISLVNLSGTEDGNVNMRLTGKIYYGK